MDIDTNNNKNYPYIIKLHGSTNWLTSHLILENGKLEMLQETNSDDFYIYESTINPYSTYEERFIFEFGIKKENITIYNEYFDDNFNLEKLF